MRSIITPSLKAPEPEQKVSSVIDALNFILAAAGCPANTRAFVDAVVGAAGDVPAADEFELADRELAARALPDRYGDKPDSGKKWVQRAREEFLTWQSGPVPVLIEFKKGYRYEQEGAFHHQKSRYKTCLRAMVTKVMLTAAASALWQTGKPGDREKALREAAEIALSTVPKNTGQLKKRDELGLDEIMSRNLKTCVTKLEKTIADLMHADRADEAMRYQAALDALKLAMEDTGDVLLSSPSPKNMNSIVEGEEGEKSEDTTRPVTAQAGTLATEDKTVPVDRPVDDACIARMAEVYPHFDVAAIYKKFLAYCQLNSKQPTQGYFFNFLSRERPAPPAQASGQATIRHSASANQSLPADMQQPGVKPGLRAMIGGLNWRARCYAELGRMRASERDKDRQGDISVVMSDVYSASPDEFRLLVEGKLYPKPDVVRSG